MSANQNPLLPGDLEAVTEPRFSREGPYSVTTWTLSGYSLIARTRSDGREEFLVTQKDNNLPTVFPSYDQDDNFLGYKVIWDSLGARDPSQATNYAMKILAAAEAATVFTEIREGKY